MQAFYPSAAWQGKEADPGTKLFFERTPVEILGGIEPLAEKKGMIQPVFFAFHNDPPPKKTGTSKDVPVNYSAHHCPE
jgi:hypothetical protein